MSINCEGRIMRDREKYIDILNQQAARVGYHRAKDNHQGDGFAKAITQMLKANISLWGLGQSLHDAEVLNWIEKTCQLIDAGKME